MDELTPLTDTIAEIEYLNDGGSYAQVVFTRRYYAPAIAAENGGQSEVSFAFACTRATCLRANDDGTANFVFTPGWFDDLSVGNLQIRWRNGEGFTADNTGVDGDYLVWDFGPLAHGQAATARVTVPVTEASAYAPDAAMTEQDYAPGGSDLDGLLANVIFVVVLLFILVIVLIWQAPARRAGAAGLGGWTAGLVVVHRRRTHHPQCARRAAPAGLPPHRTAAGLPAGGGTSRGGRRGPAQWRRHHSSCACACASSCACACACAGGGRAGCSEKTFIP